MQANQTPTLVPLAFAAGGAFNTIPEASQISTNPGGASLVDGFPPLTRTPIAAGGIPPAGLDMNGILNLITQSTRWAHAGGRYGYNAAFASDTNVVGYPSGAMLMSADGLGTWLSLADNNSDNPDTGPGTKWAPSQAYGFSAVSGLTNTNVTLTPAQAMKSRIVLTGALTANVQIILPTWTREWTIVNNTTGAFSITAKTAAGTGVVIPAGPARVVGDGTNITQPAESIAAATSSSQPLTAGQIGAIGSQGNLPINTSAKVSGVNSANLLVNGSGELGLSNWSFAANFAPQNDVTGGIGGFFGNTAALSGASGSNFTGNMAVGANVPLTLSFDAASNVSAGTYSVALVAYNSSGTFIGNVAAVTIPNGASTSTRYSAGGTTPAGTAYVTSSFNITGVTAPVNGVVWRRVKVEQGNTPSLYSQEASIATVGGGTPVVGSVRNLRMYVATASSSATVTADEIIACSALGGAAYKVGSVSQTINLAAANGIGGMDTGSAPTNGYVAIYEMVNPSTGAKGLMAVNATSSVAPSVYGGSSAPAGYTASGLLTVVPTNGSGQFAPVLVRDRNIGIPIKMALTSNSVVGTLTPISLASTIPPNAVSITGELSIASTSTSTVALAVAADSNSISQQNTTASVGSSGYVVNYAMSISTAQTILWSSANTVGTPTYNIYVSSYTI
ncbi:hypothetical protein [Burkholderia stabilis]|uniref:Uncharacterized protein n=1 Tax=Burkholderia stabilis TaxID=95485 RepID=A0AAJ5T2Q4_9BURK|nr:hypothetical protein [Burkholderia stabilis]VBB10616.1 hypothetical protein BSTAB16_0723 [Burkholderia stabilis]